MTTPHPVQISLPGQTHVAHGPHDQTGMYLMHHAFRRDLTRFEAAVRHTPVGETAVWRLLAARWDRFGTVLHHHHEVEDQAFWPAMLEAVRDDEGATADPHRDGARARADRPRPDRLHRGLRRDGRPSLHDHRNALDVHVTTTRAALLDHLRHEETEALPLLQRVLSDEQYAACEAAAAQGYPPRLVPFLVPWVADGVPADVSEHFLGEAGAAYRLMLRLLRGRHARREHRVFRYA